MALNKEALSTLIGVILIKVSTGVLSVWGSLNIYILSYFHGNGVTISPQTNSIIVLFVIVPMSVIILWATKIANKIGYQRTIRICAIIFFLAPQIINIKFSLPVFSFFCVLVPASMFAISSIPVINCLWTQFSEMKHKATSIAVFFYGLGAIIWNFLFTLIVNPNNVKATLENEYRMLFFGKEVTDNVFSGVRNGYLMCGSLFVIGSFLIKKNQNYQKLKQFEKSYEIRYQNNASLQQAGVLQYKQQEIIENLRKSIQYIKKEQILTDENDVSFPKVLLSRKFLSIFLISLFSGLYQIFINLNIKLIYMPIINDDHFLVFCVICSYTVAIFGAFIWGFIGDSKGIYASLLIFTTLDLLIKIYGCLVQTKTSILIMFMLLGLTDKAMMTIMGPGLVEMFGITIATQLLPYKGISIFLGFFSVPILYIVLSSFLQNFEFLMFLVIFSVVCMILSWKLSFMK